MTPESWATITDLFGQALDLPPDRRAAFLTRVTALDPATAGELASLLEAHERPGDFLMGLTIATPPPSDLSGRTLGAYRLVRLLGSGGMGCVYLADRSDGAFTKQVAVKVLSDPFLHAGNRFHQEREFLATLDHPSITRLLDGGCTAEGLAYLVMEYVEGEPIDRYCAVRNLPLDDRLRLLLNVCTAIAHAHQHLIVHRDIKPENVLVTAGGVVKVVDFGIAKLLNADGKVTFCRPATPAYSSPEQLQGDPITTASDVYSIGVLAYVLLTGKGPYSLRSDRIDEIVQAALTAEPTRASLVRGVAPERARRLRGDLDNILLRAIAKDPARRYVSVQQLADDLESYRNGMPVRARADTLTYRAGKFIGRYRLASAFAALTLLSLLAGIAISAWQARIAQRRFDDLRDFAHSILFDVDDALATIPGTTTARKLVVETALRYLDRLAQDNLSNSALREEIAAAYIRIGKVQGSAPQPNLGDTAGAIASFQKGVATADRDASTVRLTRLLIEGHINIAVLAADPAQAIPDFRAAIRAGEKLVRRDASDVETLRLIADAYHGLGRVSHLTDQVREEEEVSGREIELRQRIVTQSAGHRQDAVQLADAWAQHALAREQMADYTGSLTELRLAQSILERGPAGDSHNQLTVRALADKRSRAGSVLRAMGQYAQSTDELKAVIALLGPLAAADPQNMQYRVDLAYAWFRLAETLRAQSQLSDALAAHQKALAMRRQRAAHDQNFTFILWDLSRSLNAVADLLLATAPQEPADAAALFKEARAVTEQALARAPSFNELRKQLAYADEGLARVTLLGDALHTEHARRLLERSLQTWDEVLAYGSGDARDRDEPERLRALLATLSSR